MTDNQWNFVQVCLEFGGVGLFMFVFGVIGFILGGISPIGITAGIVAILGVVIATLRIYQEWLKNQ